MSEVRVFSLVILGAITLYTLISWTIGAIILFIAEVILGIPPSPPHVVAIVGAGVLFLIILVKG